MKIGDRIYVRGYVDEIRKDTVIVRNDGGYFGTIPSEVITGELPSVQPEKRTEERAETHACDLIDRQAAIDAVKKNTFRLTFAEEQNCEGHVAWSANAVYSDVIEGALLELPSVLPEPSEITDEQAILHLQSTGWMQNHDREIYESGLKERLADDSESYDSLIPYEDDEDTISRQAAIEALADMHCKSDEDGYVWIIRSDAWARIDALPSAQPEIIRCKDCKFGEQDEVGRWFCRSLGCQIGNEDGSGYCADAERRTDGGLNQQAGSN